ncbi:MAG: DAK2 domain-containing protein [Acetilactobacillus jinshanensis]
MKTQSKKEATDLSAQKINVDLFSKMVQAASIELNHNAKFINSLNVFPVPDGDTGTNMKMSMASGEKYVSSAATQSVGELAGSLAKGLLMGARGNSGVILSQIFRGFYKSVQNKRTLSAQDVVDAFAYSAKAAYKAVMKPTEGTILTVIRMAAQAGLDKIKKTHDLPTVFDAIYKGSEKALKKTPDLLPVLKKVGVVDSGGQGLVLVLKAFNAVIHGKSVKDDRGNLTTSDMTQMIKAAHHRSAQSKLNPADIKYGYCTQMTVRFGRGKEADRKFQYKPFYDHLAKLGNSLLVVNDDEVVKVHVHTEHPGKVLAWGQHFGDLTKVKVDNMRLQQEDIIDHDKKVQATAKKKIAKEEKPKNMAVIAVVSGHGLKVLFKSLGVTNFVSGGQTMNPSTQDILNVIKGCNAKHVIILPNNGNIYMAAKAAAKVANVPTAVIHCKTINQGMAVMLGYDPNASLKENQAQMSDNLDEAKSGEVTYATRDSTVDDVNVKKGQYIGIVDGKITVTDADIIKSTVKMVKSMLDDMSEVVTIIYGEDTDQKSAKQVEKGVKKLNPDLETEVHEGDQPVYPFLISVE